MRAVYRTTVAFIIFLILPGAVSAQLGLFSREQRIDFTRAWQGGRFDDGRPKAPDSILERMKTVSAEEAWGVLREAGFHNQFTGGWKQFNISGSRLVGRAVTARFMPLRPDTDAVIKSHAAGEGRIGPGQQSWVIDTLQPGDIFVADLYGKIIVIGDNLATSIFTKSKNGVVINGGIRDLTGIAQIDGFQGYYRFSDPGVFENSMLMGINVPIRIDNATIMPGDVVLGDPEGVTFVPPQLAEKIVITAEDIHLRDEWGHLMLRQGRYTPGQIDSRWSPEMEADFHKWTQTRKPNPSSR
ncbi:MAG: RraA family protein [Bryobacterales bacterium]|nr:RraA family protein [Bryobacterales bacterium]